MRAATAAAILAFCAQSSVAAPAPAPVDNAFDPGFSLRCLDSPDLTCPPPGEDEFGQPQIIGKRGTQIIPFVAGARLGVAAWKLFNLFDKRDADAEPFWDFSKINPNDDSPFNPFDDEGLPGKAKRDVAEAPVDKRGTQIIPFVAGARLGVAAWKLFNLFDKRDTDAFLDGIVEKRDEAESPVDKRQFGLGLRVGAAIGKAILFGDDDDKKKRDALVDDLPVVSDVPVLGDLLEQLDEILDKIPVVGNLDEVLAKLPIVGDLPVLSDILKDDDAATEKTKRDALIDLDLPIVGDLPVVGDLENLPVVGDLPVVSDLLDNKVKREPFLDKLRDFLNKIGADPTDDDPLNPFDDPGLPGKRDAAPVLDKLRDFLVKIGADPTDDDPLNPFDDPGLPGKRSAKAFTA